MPEHVFSNIRTVQKVIHTAHSFIKSKGLLLSVQEEVHKRKEIFSMYRKPKLESFSAGVLQKTYKAGACIILYQGCGRKYTTCVIKYDK